jgi:hypothetical protein
LKQLDWRTPDGYETCKELFNRVLYSGKFDTWCYDNDLKMVYDEPPSFITNLVDELDEMAEIIKTNNLLARFSRFNRLKPVRQLLQSQH